MGSLPSSGPGEHTEQPEAGRPVQPDLDESRPGNAGDHSAPVCARCEYNLTGSLKSDRCPECGWPIDWKVAFHGPVPTGPPGWAVASLLVCVISVLHFLLTSFLVTPLVMAGFAGPPQGRWLGAIESLTLRVVLALYLPISLCGPGDMTMDRLLINSAIWGVVVTAALFGLYDLTKKLRAWFT